MQRVTMTIDDEQLVLLDAHARRRGYTSRSEALRDILRQVAAEEASAVEAEDTPCLATLSYIYEHETRELARRLTHAQHRHPDLSISTLHVHVDEGDCLEVTVLKGPVSELRAFADAVISQRGVRMGHLHVMPVAAPPPDHEPHPHPHR